MRHSVREQVAQPGEVLVDRVWAERLPRFHRDDLFDGLLLVLGNLPHVRWELHNGGLEVTHDGLVDSWHNDVPEDLTEQVEDSFVVLLGLLAPAFRDFLLPEEVSLQVRECWFICGDYRCGCLGTVASIAVRSLGKRADCG